MTTNQTEDARLLSTLGSAEGRGVVRIVERFSTGIDDLWSAITEPRRLARWWGRVEGDLQVGGTFALSAEWDGGGRVDACEAPRHLHVTVRESDESYRRGNGVPPFDSSIDAALVADGDETILRLEVRGMPLEKIAFYGVGWQVHVEHLRAHLTGTDLGDTEARWQELLPHYLELAEQFSQIDQGARDEEQRS